MQEAWGAEYMANRSIGPRSVELEDLKDGNDDGDYRDGRLLRLTSEPT